MRAVTTTHGKAGSVGPVRCRVNFQAAVDRTVVNESSLGSTYLNSIRPAILSKVESTWGGASIIEREDAAVDPASNTLSVEMIVWLEGLADDEWAYETVTRYRRDVVSTYRNKWDGHPTSTYFWTSGWVVTAVTSVTRTSSKSSPPDPVKPGLPPSFMQAGGDGRWNVLADPEALVRPIHFGATPEGTPVQTYYIGATTTAWRWVDSNSTEVVGVGPIGRIKTPSSSDVRIETIARE